MGLRGRLSRGAARFHKPCKALRPSPVGDVLADRSRSDHDDVKDSASVTDSMSRTLPLRVPRALGRAT